MALVTMFQHGSLTVTAPAVTTDSIATFGLTCEYAAPAQEVISWHQAGTDGEQKKLLGVGGKSGTVTGFLDCSSAANLHTAVDGIDNKITQAVPATAYCLDNTIQAANALVTKCVWGNFVRTAAGRYLWYFTLYWEAP